MTITVASPMLAQIGVVVILAHFFGVEGMGLYAYHYAIASFFGLVSVFGFPVYLQRELAARPDDFDAIHSDALSFKLLLDGLLLIIALLLPFILEIPKIELFYIFVFVRFTMAYNSFFLVEFRVMEAFQTESRLAACGNFSYFIFALLAGLLTRSLEGVALGLLFAQLLVLVCVLTIWRAKSGRKLLAFTTSNLKQTFRKNLPYALDQGLAEFLGHITSFLIGLNMGAAALGIYQAGLRITNGVLSLASIVGGAFIAKMSEYWSSDRDLFRREAKRARLIFHIIGISAFLIFWVAGAYITTILYTVEFNSLNALWPLFGLYVASRYFASVPGLVLVAAGFQKVRVKVNIFSAILVLSGFKLSLSCYGLSGLLGLLCISGLFTAICYYYVIYRYSVLKGDAESL